MKQVTKTKEINGKNYQVAPFTAVEALRLKAHLIKIIAPSLGELISGADVNNIDANKVDIAGAIEKLTSALNEDEFIEIVKKLFQNVIVTYKDEKGKKHSASFANDFDAVMNEVFQCELFSIYDVMKFVLEVNYPDFFQKVLPRIGLKTKAIDTLERDEEE